MSFQAKQAKKELPGSQALLGGSCCVSFASLHLILCAPLLTILHLLIPGFVPERELSSHMDLPKLQYGPFVWCLLSYGWVVLAEKSLRTATGRENLREGVNFELGRTGGQEGEKGKHLWLEQNNAVADRKSYFSSDRNDCKQTQIYKRHVLPLQGTTYLTRDGCKC